ncbi:formate/nitrite transporter family protein [Actinomycetospora endophytica]|uniref:Formate/nitrite transporter family protein n=1 Tax=Actinomycetospora endophytica TaxID=2291215 RepID=A0ABS8PAC9_9PSEU|nr:formate/nitrite transporter family protein [Actinomycetospora endophytica]MCD2194366.1 formate/nitrite transporter family protein [Actinomycetospora endophytica]
MPIPVPEAIDEQAEVAASKSRASRSPGSYLVSAALAGAYVGVAVCLMLAAAGPLNGMNSPFTKLVQGLVFGIALTLVVFAGGELTTGNMMTMVIALFDRAKRTGPGAVVAVIVFSFVGNLVGGLVFSLLIEASGVLKIANPGQPPAMLNFLLALAKSKSTESISAMFFRGVLCNFLVCLGVWMAARTRSDGAKLVVLFWALLAFITTGFDHVVANMTVLALGLFSGAPGVTVGSFASNMLWVGLGNLVGGALLGAGYAYISRGEKPIGPEGVADSAVPRDREVAQA